MIRNITGQLVFCAISPNFMRDVCVQSKQFYVYFDVIFSLNQCGFRIGSSVVNGSLPLTEKWRESLDQSGTYRGLLTDLLKAFNCLHHELIIAKL